MGKVLRSDTAQLMRLKKTCTIPEWSWCSSKGLTCHWLKNVRSLGTLLATHAHMRTHIYCVQTANLASVDTRTQPTTHLHLIPGLWSCICLGSAKPGIVYGCRVSHTHTPTRKASVQSRRKWDVSCTWSAMAEVAAQAMDAILIHFSDDLKPFFQYHIWSHFWFTSLHGKESLRQSAQWLMGRGSKNQQAAKEAEQ